jgi:hypothetical protein
MTTLLIQNKLLSMPVAFLAAMMFLAPSIHAQSQTGNYGFASE